MEKHWATKQQVKHDEVRDAVGQGFEWLLLRKREAGIAAGVTVGAIALIGLILYSRAARANAAWDKLSLSELYAYMGRPQEAEATADLAVSEGGSAGAAALARILQGDLRAPRGEFDKALAAYAEAAENGPAAIKPFARANKAAALEAAGKHAEAAAEAAGFLDAYPDHLLAPMVLSGLARAQQAQGQGDAAKASLQKIALQYPDTPWAAWANSRLQPPAK